MAVAEVVGAGVCSKVLGELRKKWFIVSLVAVILLARVYPYFGSKGGEENSI